MKIKFYKYQGTGNDFILFDNREGLISRENRTWFAQICDRRFGIGADGVMLLENKPGFDFEMVYYNADGGESSMCGNGGRCMVNFAAAMATVKDHYLFTAVDGAHEAVRKEGIVELKMTDVSSIEAGDGSYRLNTGSPHYVCFTDGLSQLDVKKAGAAIRYSERFRKEGINVNFLEKVNGVWHIRTYERGVEDETLSCGTGVTAAALVLSIFENTPSGKVEIALQTMGGKLTIRLNKIDDQHFTDIWLIGPGAFVFEGTIDLPQQG